MPHGSIRTPLGDVTVFAEGNAIVAVRWQAANCGLMSDLVLSALEQLEGYFAGERRSFTLPLDARGSDFQRRAWSALRDIPFGHTVTYGALAARLGTAPRAIARACAHNPVPIIVPCHRVVAGGGALGGYSGGRGVETKGALLALEGVKGSP